MGIMNYRVGPRDHAMRAQALRRNGERASLIYAALELRCGIEARLQQHASVAIGLSKNQADCWEIKKLGRTIESAFGLGDTMLLVFLKMGDGRTCQFMYVPVSERLREIGKRCGDYLHAMKSDRVNSEDFWRDLRSMVTEGCGLLEMACSSEILRPTPDAGLHFHLERGDPRYGMVEELMAGAPGVFTAVTITPTSPVLYVPGDDA